MGEAEFIAQAGQFDAAQERFLRGVASVLQEPAESLGIETGTAVSPILDQWPRLDEAAYHGVAGEVVRTLEPHTEADPVSLLGSFLAEAGTMIGRSTHMILDGTHHPLLFWPVLVGQSSKSRKGTAGKRIQAVFAQADPMWTRGECRGTLSSGEGVAFAVRDQSFREEPLKDKGRPTGETVTVCVDPGVTDKRLFLVQAEFGAVLRVMQRDGNSLSGVLRDAWDGLDLAPMTKANRVRATAPHIGIVGHVTKDELLRNLTNTEASNGFGNRFVWLAVKRSKELPFPSEPDSSVMKALASRTAAMIQRGRHASLLEMGPDAREGWKAIYSDLSADRPGLAGALLGRAEAQVMRLAGLYTMLDGRSKIEPVHLQAALALWQYAEASTRLIFGDSLGDPIADTILRAVRSAAELTDSQLSDLFGRHVSAARLDQAKTLLHEAGLIHCDTATTNGRPRVLWMPGAKKAK